MTTRLWLYRTENIGRRESNIGESHQQKVGGLPCKSLENKDDRWRPLNRLEPPTSKPKAFFGALDAAIILWNQAFNP
jgi:hypothetical protein